jgi:hypothetical protein
MRKIVSLAAFAVIAAWGADPPQLSGTWVFDPGHAAKLKISTLEIHQSADTVECAPSAANNAKSRKPVRRFPSGTTARRW